MGRTKKFRGKRTHGKGKKAGRGAGKRGGRGQAGLHKHKFKSMIKYDPYHFGVHGFRRHPSLLTTKKAINLSEVEERIYEFLEKGVAVVKDEKLIVNLKNVGIDKLLGGGKARTPMHVIVREASRLAQSKIEERGGRILKEEDG